MRVGIEPDLVPIAFAGPDGRPKGFVVDLLDAIGTEMNLDIQYVVRPRAALMEEFSAGRIDALPNIVKTDEREAQMAFSVPHLVLTNVLLVRRDDHRLRSLADLRQLRISVVSSARVEEYLRRHGLAAQAVLSSSLADALHAVSENRADAIIATGACANDLIRREALPNLVPSAVKPPEPLCIYHIALHPDDRFRLADLNEGLQRLRDNGTYDDLYRKWLGPLEPRPLYWSDLRPYLIPALLVLVAIAALVFWQRRMMGLLARQARELRVSQERLTLVLDGGHHGLWDWHVPSGRIDRNARTAALVGCTESELPATHSAWVERIHAEDRPSFEAAVDQLTLSNHESFVVHYRMAAKDGQWRWIASSGKVLERDSSGHPLRVAGTHTDLTAQKRMEEERVAFQQKVLEAQKLESLGLLAGGIAHDFNNLLTVVLGQATLLRVANNPPDELETSLQQIESAARRASDLCKQMLVYAGGGTFSMQPVDLNSLLTGIAPLLHHSVRKDAVLDFQLAGNLPRIEADPTQIRQIVMNLVINASEALPASGGVITVTTACRPPTHAEMRDAVHISDIPPGPRVCLSIRDNGSGMTPAVRAKIFEPFFTTKFTGRGLGLAAVLGIVRAHRGIFSVHSVPGNGSTFTLFLGASQSLVTESPATEPVLPAGAARKATILIADDEPAVLAMAVAVLRHHGYDVVSATTGREAVARFATAPGRFGAVVLDFTMPEMNGVGALMEIRRTRPGVPAVLMSGFGAADAFERLPAENPPLFLQKPFAQHELLARVAEAAALGGGVSGTTGSSAN